MTVKVYGDEAHEHADGTGLDVRDGGHLLVLDTVGVSRPKQIAIYAPDTWKRAEVTK
jgi:hypothetical protein